VTSAPVVRPAMEPIAFQPPALTPDGSESLFGDVPFGLPPVEGRPPIGHDPADTPRLTLGARGLALLGAEGFSCGFAIWCLRAGPRLLSYMTANDLGVRGRTFLFADMAAGALVACFLGLLYAVLRRRRATIGRSLSNAGWRLAPLAVIGLVPLFLKWEYWQGRELTVLALALIFVLSLQTLTRAALSTPPLGLFGAWTARPRAAFARLGTRLRPLRRHLPLILVVVGAAGYAAFFAAVTITNHRNLRTTSWDLGLEDNLIWNALHWSRPFFKSSPLGGPTASHFGYHATFLAYLLAIPYAISPRAETLLIIQGVFVGAAAIPLFLFARRRLGAFTACVLAYVYLLYPPVHGANLYDFHYPPLGVFFIWLTLFALDSRRNVLAVFAALLTLATREDVGAGLAIVGAFFLLTGQRPRAGLLVALVGVVYVVVMKMIIMPRALQGASAFTWMYHDLVPPGDDSFGGVLKTVIGNPAFTLHTLIERDKLLYLLHLFTPLAFLPLRRPIGLMFCLPGFFFTLLSSNYAPLIQTSFQYTADWTMYLFIALVANLEWTGRPRHAGDTRGPARQKAWLLAVVVGTLVCTYQFGAIFQQNTVRGGFGLYAFSTTPADLVRRKAVHDLIAQVPKNAKIVSAENLVPQVSNRPDAYTLRFGLWDADYLLFGLPVGGAERTNAYLALKDGTFGVVDVRDGFVLARRGQKPDKNPTILPQVQ
jgi:uncharacterized membrane protein